MTGPAKRIDGSHDASQLPVTMIETIEEVSHDEPSHAHHNAPQPEAGCLYGLVGEVARAGSQDSETNAFAIGANFMAYLSCAIGRGVYLPIGNTRHHARLFCLHIGRSGRGRKGDAVSLVLRIDEALRAMAPSFAPQIHRGGLSTREGLVTLIHDGYRQGQQDIPPIEDKRLWVVESEFANVLHQGRRNGNTLSAALRDCWDGVHLKPATKTNRVYASNPHLSLSGAISPSELTGLMNARELSNGFANRFLMIWAERTRILPFPKETPQSLVEHLAMKTLPPHKCRQLRLRMQEQVRAEGVTDNLRLFMPEMVLQILHHGPNLLFERQIPEITPRFTTGDIETTVHQALAETGPQLPPIPGQVVDGSLSDRRH